MPIVYVNGKYKACFDDIDYINESGKEALVQYLESEELVNTTY